MKKEFRLIGGFFNHAINQFDSIGGLMI